MALALASMVVACDEKLEGGMACPALCPGNPTPVRDTTLFAVDLDTTITGFPTIGGETELLLAARGDTLDARAILRFDSLPTTFRHNNTAADSSIISVDSARIRLVIAFVDSLGPPVTVELYDVDVNTGEDTSVADLAPAFSPARLIGSATFDSARSGDTLDVPLMAEKLLEKIQVEDAALRRLRVGVRVAAPASAQVGVFSSNSPRAAPPQLIFRPSPATTVQAVQLGTLSKTPASLPLVAGDLGDFQLIAVAPPAEPANVLRIGGIPGTRAYLRFAIPTEILDSSTIVRAQLRMTQRPNPGAPDARDTAAVQPFAIASSGVLTDISRTLLFLSVGLDSVRLVPADSAERVFEIIGLVRSWRGTSAERTPRVVALRATTEGSMPWEVDFFSNEAPDAVRPRLRITYVPRSAPGIP